MPITFTCPHCGSQANVADQYAGQTSPCAQCGESVTFPPPCADTVYAPRKPRSWLRAILRYVAIIGILFVIWLTVQAVRKAAWGANCRANLQHISMALLFFEYEHGRFPATVDPTKPDQPPCSWRVQTLPYLDHNQCFERYDVTESWNGPKNHLLADPMPVYYHCPGNDTLAPLNTDYLGVSGPKAILRDVGSTTAHDVTDGLTNTLMVVESHQSGIHWMEPRDMKADDAAMGINSRVTGGIESAHPGGANVAFASGAVGFISDSVDPEVLKAMTTINGGEKVEHR
jgi:hypothetical protein